MARRPSTQRPSGQAGPEGQAPGLDEAPPNPPGTTRRFLVLMDEKVGGAAAKLIGSATGLQVASAADFAGGVVPDDLDGADAAIFPTLGVAVVNAAPDQVGAMRGQNGGGAVLAIEPERTVYAFEERGEPGRLAGPGFGAGQAGLPLEYLRGFKDAVEILYERLAGGDPGVGAAGVSAPVSEAELTWGLQVTKAAASRYTGRGIRVAVLDTGLDTVHPDVAGRTVQALSFVQGQAVMDRNGHGTHCIGTACGPRRPNMLPRYGVAYEAEIYAGKVLSDQGSGADAGILAGIEWSLANGCAIVSMSLGAAVQVGQPYSQVFENVARRALSAGTLIVAAAGNESRRPSSVAPVAHPANCPSIMAVGAVDRDGRIAPFSNGGLNPQGGQVDIVGPGVAIRSSWPRPTLYRSIDGTSMATPHVAGIAALWAEVDPNFRGRALMSMLTQTARRLSLPGRDAGAGLVQAP